MGSACCGESLPMGKAASCGVGEMAFPYLGCHLSAVNICETIMAEGPMKKRTQPPSQFAARDASLEAQIKELFRLHDLNNDGFLEEAELVQLNSKVALLHHGNHADLGAVKAKFRALYREKFDAEGRPVPYEAFRRHWLTVLDSMDRKAFAQEMIMDQYIVEAGAARQAFKIPSFVSVSDVPFLPHMRSNSTVVEELRSPRRFVGPTASRQDARSDTGLSPIRRRHLPGWAPSSADSRGEGAVFGGA